MSTIYKVFVLDHPVEGNRDAICVKPYLDNFENFKEEIFIRFPELRDAQLNIFYEGGCCHFLFYFFVPHLLGPQLFPILCEFTQLSVSQFS